LLILNVNYYNSAGIGLTGTTRSSRLWCRFQIYSNRILFRRISKSVRSLRDNDDAKLRVFDRSRARAPCRVSRGAKWLPQRRTCLSARCRASGVQFSAARVYRTSIPVRCLSAYRWNKNLVADIETRTFLYFPVLEYWNY